MSTLEEAIATRFPAVWVSTQDNHRVVSKITRLSRNRVFRIDPFEGLVEFLENQWRVVLAPDPEGEIGPIQHPQLIFNYVYHIKGTLIMEFAEKTAEDYVEVISALLGKYRDAFMQDDDKRTSASVYMISPGDGPPAIFGRNIFVVHDQFPQADEVALLYGGIKDRVTDALGEDDNAAKLVRSSVGLSESEILTSSLQLIRHKGFIDAGEMNTMRTALLKSGANIDLVRADITFDDLGGMDLAKQLIEASAIAFASGDPDADVMNKILMIGVPGCGKSALCKATANRLGLDLARTGVAHQMSKWIGESERNMRHTLASIFAMSPVVVWIDELGRDLSGSGSSNDGGTTDRVHGEFLTGLQEMPSNVFLMAAANRIDGLPPEMLRSGRFDKILFVGFPAGLERLQIFKIYLKDTAEEMDLDVLVNASEGFTGAEIEQVVKEFFFNVKHSICNKTTQDLVNMLIETKNLVIVRHAPAIMEMYRRAKFEWNWASSAQRDEADRILSGDFGPLKAMQVASSPTQQTASAI
jgi:SpoVK/Ycf46/Vps4 family AAA+-type ATPase